MSRPRGSILLIWIICVVISVISLYDAVSLLFQSADLLHKLGDAGFALVPIFFALPAALIITRQPHNKIGWLLIIYPLVEIPSGLLSAYLSGFQSAPPPVTFFNLFMTWLVSYSWMALIFPLLLIPLFFPTGRLISPRWRWTIYLIIAMTLFLSFFGAFSREIQPDFASWTMHNPVGFIPDNLVDAIIAPWSILLAVLTVASLTSVVVRYRRGSIVVRQQMKWLLYACFLFGLVYIPNVFSNLNTSQWSLNSVTNLLFPFAIMAIPAAITIAILRYHLFDIDVIIRLTIIYVILTGLLGMFYLGGVILFQQVLRAITGQNADIAVVATTLIIAAMFNPLRRRIQIAIDRRFFRQRYNVEQALAQFAFAIRGSADLDSLTAMLTNITQETLQPAQISLHLKKELL
jgi:hypothetical protein